MKPAKKLTGVALLAATALTLAGCGGATEASSTHTSAAPGSVTLRMTTWTSDATQLALFKSVADSYKKSHPEIKEITFDSLPVADYTSTLTTQIAGGNAPDMAWVLEKDAPDFVKSGALAPLTDTLKAAPDYNYADLNSETTKLWTQDNQLYAYPFSTSPLVMFANDSLLKQAGLPTSAELQSQGKWNWQDLAALGSMVKAKTDKDGIIIRDFNYSDWSNLASVWNAWGAAPWSSDGKSCTFNSPEMNTAFTYIHDGIFKQHAFPGPGTSPDFFAGDSAFTVTQISRASLLKDAKFGWNVLPLPTATKGSYSVVGQAGVGALAKGSHVQESEDFIAYLTNPSNAKQLAQFFPPPRTSLLTADTLAATNKLLSKEQIQNAVIKGIAEGQTKASHTNSAEISQKVKAALDPMWQPTADVSSVLNNVCSAIKPLLAG
ncbi:ABC transporter substrate-binding protein [Arthrobacter sp. Soil764]|uniref:ABC transporter substrate-binding protein n=1 Tax=Arthrobacter sp. Soil764 TaxID=1736403 RepID=UPI0006F8F873|nr:extracellular solute-binding protein [Arthrobacter sp. Soil764]KRE91171.1 sugar ABC transporter substrate-binding protein [Arthrobacter sp. Soil764]